MIETEDEIIQRLVRPSKRNKTRLNLPTGYLSPTQIEMYLRCPEQYRRRYVEGKKEAPDVSMVEGGSYHVAMKVNNTHKKDKGRDLPVKQLVDAFGGHFNEHEGEIEDWKDEKKDNIIERSRGLFTEYLSVLAPRLMPLEAEHNISVDVDGIEVIGIVDLEAKLKRMMPHGVSGNSLLAKKIVADYKTVSRAKSESDLDGSIQLSCYSLATNTPIVGFINLFRTTGKVLWQPTEVTIGRMRWFKEIVKSVAQAISAGNFPLTNPTNWCCDPRWCGYYKDCRGKFEK